MRTSKNNQVPKQSFRVGHTGSIFKRRVLFPFALLVLIISAVYLVVFYDGDDKNASPKQLPILQALETLEHNKDHVGLMRLLYQASDTNDSDALIAWLRERDNMGYAPYYYGLSRQYLLTKQPYQALQYYMLGGITARIDAARCSDDKNAQWVAFLESGFDGVAGYMKEGLDTKLTAGTWVLLKEDNIADRPVPAWLCERNIKGNVSYVAQEIWQVRRDDIRREFKTFIELPVNPSASEVQE